MEALLRLARRASYAHYLAVEQTSERRYEFFDGVIVAMAGASDAHDAIAEKFAKLLSNRETGTCRYCTPAQRFWIASRIRARYADGSMICGAPEHPRHDDHATTNPTIVVEVMPPSREGDDGGEKRSDFQSLASLQAYVLAAQDRRHVKVYRRAGAIWAVSTHADGDSFELPTLSGPIRVAEIYDGILDPSGTSLLV